MRIPSSKYAAMQHMLMLVSHGYRYWFRGEVKYDKAIALSDKLHSLYPLTATHDSRAWARKTKRYAAHLLMYPHDKDKTKIQFWLLATAGEPMPGFAKIHEREKLSDGNESGLAWADQYLIEKRKDQEHLTWTMRNDYYKRLKAEMDQAAIEGERAVKKLWDNLIHMPMYNGIRAQLRELDSYSRHVWQKRHRKAPYPLPDLFLPFAGRVKVFEDMILEHLVAAIKKREENAEAAGLEQARKLLDKSDNAVEKYDMDMLIEDEDHEPYWVDKTSSRDFDEKSVQEECNYGNGNGLVEPRRRKLKPVYVESFNPGFDYEWYGIDPLPMPKAGEDLIHPILRSNDDIGDLMHKLSDI